MAIFLERLTAPVSGSFFCGVMKFSFRGLPLFFGGSTFLVPTRVGKVAVAISPSRARKTTVDSSKVTFRSAIGDYSTI